MLQTSANPSAPAAKRTFAFLNKFVEATDLLLFVTGIFLLAFFATSRISSRWHSHRALTVFAENRKEAIQSAGGVSFSLWSPTRIKEYQQSLSAATDSPIAVLQIAKIHLTVPVFPGTSDLVLNRGTGWIEGTAQPGEDGNIGIAGHRDGFFRGLKDLVVGDVIQLQTLTQTDSYVVKRIEIVSPADVNVLGSSPTPQITLVTCYPFYYVGSAPERYIVEATETAKEPAKAGANN
jgi:sortase A